MNNNHKLNILKTEYMKNRKKNLPIEAIHQLVKEDYTIPKREIAFQNDCYGVATDIKQYASLEENCIFNFAIEHGTYLLEDYIYPIDIIPRTPVICMGDYRKEFLENKVGKRAYAIGPYIAYAEEYYSEKKYQETKKKYGKILLVFPTHSTAVCTEEYDIKEFIRRIEEIKGNYDTVMVCLYWLDIQQKLWKLYKDMGYTIVCAGHGNDALFLSRLKTILRLSDAVVFNDIGTGLGYATYLGKPCWVYNQKIESKVVKSASETEMKYANEYYELKEAFKHKDFIKTSQQFEICNYLFGFDRVLKKEEMKRFLEPLIIKR